MTATGRQHSSAELAAWLQTQLEQVGTLAFLIGGPVGFDPATIAAAHEQLALSRLTLPHELARVVLLEQLYRAFTIIHGEPYHK
jgi:23S rRNA (pseudouridine1915-N3)-methyltransferase